MGEVFYKPVSTKKDADDKVGEAFSDLVDEELAAVKEELSLSGLNFPLLRAKLMRKWSFYLAVIFLQLFTAFRCRQTANAYPVPDGSVIRGNTIFHCEGVYNDGIVDCDDTIRFESLPLASAWAYVPPNIAISLDKKLCDAFESKERTTGQKRVCLRGSSVHKPWSQPKLARPQPQLCSALNDSVWVEYAQ